MVSSGQETLLWIGFAGMTLGAIAIGLTGRRLRPEDRHHPVASLFVCLIAACSYFAMANSQGVVETGGRTVFYARYVDWAFTTPLLLLTHEISDPSGRLFEFSRILFRGDKVRLQFHYDL